MPVSVNFRYQIKIKGYSLRIVGPISISAAATTESAVLEAVRKREYADKKQVEGLVIPSVH